MDSELIRLIAIVGFVLIYAAVKKVREVIRTSAARHPAPRRPEARREAMPRREAPAPRQAMPRMAACVSSLTTPPAVPDEASVSTTAPAPVGSEEGQRVTADAPLPEPERPAPAIEPPTLAELRRAVVWSEILKPKFEQ